MIAQPPDLSWALVYDAGGSGELTQAHTPFGGYLRWTYANYTYPGSRTQREIQNRYVSLSAGAPELAAPLNPLFIHPICG